MAGSRALAFADALADSSQRSLFFAMSKLQPGTPLLLEATPAPALQFGNQRSSRCRTLLRQRLRQGGIGRYTGRRQEFQGDVTVAHRRRQIHHGTQSVLKLLSTLARKELAEYPQALRQPANGDAQVVDGAGVTGTGRPVRLESQPPQQCRRLPDSMIAYENIYPVTLLSSVPLITSGFSRLQLAFHRPQPARKSRR